MLCSYRNILVSRRLPPHFGVNLVGQCHQAASAYPCPQISFPPPKFDYSFLLDPVSLEKMRKNIELRKSEADLDKVVRLHRLFSQTGDRELEKDLLEETTRLPNMCTERVLDMADDNKILYQGSVLQPEFKLRKFEEIARILSGARGQIIFCFKEELTFWDLKCVKT